MAHLFNSVHEQSYVAYVICYAMQIGIFEGYDPLDPAKSKSTYVTCGITVCLASFFLVLFFYKRF